MDTPVSVRQKTVACAKNESMYVTVDTNISMESSLQYDLDMVQ